MGKDRLAGVLVALIVAVTFVSAQTPTNDQTKQTESVSQQRASRSPAIPDLPLDRVGIPDESLAMEYDPIFTRCAGLLGLKTRFRITGTLRSRRVDAELRLGLGPGPTIRLEPVVRSGSASFVLQANDGGASHSVNDERGALLIRPGNRIVRDKVAALTEAVIGLPITEQELFEILAGCPTLWSTAGLSRLGPDWFRLTTLYGDEAILETYWHRDGSHPWEYSAAIHHTYAAPERKWRIDLLERRHEIFERIRIRSMNWVGEFDGQDDITLVREFGWLDDGSPVMEPIPATARETSLADLKGTLPLITAPSIRRSPSPQVREPARR